MHGARLLTKTLPKLLLLFPLALLSFATPALSLEPASITPPLVDFNDPFTQGVGFNYRQPDGSFVDFRSSDFLPSAPLSLGNLTIFLEDGATVVYTTSADRIKEEIVLYEKPAS